MLRTRAKVTSVTDFRGRGGLGTRVELQERQNVIARMVPAQAALAGLAFVSKRTAVSLSPTLSLYLSDRHCSEAERRMTSRPRSCFAALRRAEWTHAVPH